MGRCIALLVVAVVGLPVDGSQSVCRAARSATIVCSPRAGFQETLAAREIRRYAYLRSGRFLPIARRDDLPAEGDAIVVIDKSRSLAIAPFGDTRFSERVSMLRPGQYLLKTFTQGTHRVLVVVGGDPIGTLHGAYRLAEHFGIGLFLHGDVVPDHRTTFALPELEETGKPLFRLRGLNPWGSHPLGFDQWSTDDYMAHIGQLAKMRMNFIGMHCYPEGHPYAEPTVWHGLGNSQEQMKGTIDDILVAREALENVGAPFQLATAGWVLGPNDDRAAFDRWLPKEIAVSAISRRLGHDPIDDGFGRIEGRGKWAIPWMESDTYHGIANPQLFVSRTRKDAADALAYGCDGLMGLMWRSSRGSTAGCRSRSTVPARQPDSSRIRPLGTRFRRSSASSTNLPH
ncbi:MAG: hypothetical protein V3R99_11445 [Thermoguttaceae bacterium]